MRRLLSMLCLAAGLMVGAGCCHTCDVCDDCGGCGNEPYAMSNSGCATCGNSYAAKPAVTKKATSIAMPVKSTVKTR